MSKMSSQFVQNGIEQQQAGQHDQDDEVELLNIFPEEVWELIFEKVKNGNDLENCANAAAFFRRFISSKRVIFLFPKVFSLLAPYYENGPSRYFDVLNKTYARRIERTWRYPGSYSLICSEWNTAVRQYFQENTSHVAIHGVRTSWLEHSGCHKLFAPAQVEYLGFERVDGMSILEGIPKPIRSLSLIIRPGFQIDNDSAAEKLLRKYGRDLWHLELSKHGTSGNSVENYLTSRKLLKCVPNLRYLGLHHTHFTKLEDGEHLDYIIRLNPIPTFKFLKYLHFKTDSNIPLTYYADMLKNNSTIQQFIVSTIALPFFTLNSILSSKHPFLTELSLIVCDIQSQLDVLRQFGKHLKLKKFKGRFCFLRSREEIRGIFEMIISKWSGSLQDLWIEAIGGYENAEIDLLQITSSCRLTLSKLKTITLETANAVSLDLLLGCAETLETIHVTSYGSFNDEFSEAYNKTAEDQVVEYLRFEDRMEQSNIWTLFPRLDFIISGDFRVWRPSILNISEMK